MDRIVRPVMRLAGTVKVPADKSIAHRAAIFAALATGTSRLQDYPKGADTLTTLRCLAKLGVDHEWEGDAVVITGRGVRGLEKPSEPLDCGNSGTTMRLLTGLLAGQSFDSTLTGDDSLTRRPMERVAGPLRTMGASIELTNGRAPIRIQGGDRLSGVEHKLAIASAQVKTAMILAGLTADSHTRILEPVPSRDHTERMLGLRIQTSDDSPGRIIDVEPRDSLEPLDIRVPGDFSSAAFFICGATIVPDSELRLESVGLNPTRTGLLEVMHAAGADIQIELPEAPDGARGLEPVGDIIIRSTKLTPLTVEGGIVPLLVDEVPVLAVTATQVDGVSRFSDIGELRAKESDRIETTTRLIELLGGRVESDVDSMTVSGKTGLAGAKVDSHGDHRIAMAAAIAGLVAEGETRILNAESASVSYPSFWDDLERVSVT